MRVLLTGGSGSVGKAVIDRLVKRGFSVLVIGRRPDLQFEGAEYQACDVNDYPRLREVIRGCNAVIHLAAIPNPGKGTPEEIFRVNCSGTFNVFQAAAEEGIKRVVQASSINATGQYFGVKPAPLNYLPIDEAHPVFSTDGYSFSKNIIEQIGEFFWNRDGISSVAMRLPYVAPQEYRQHLPEMRQGVKALVDKLCNLSSEERLAWFTSTWQTYNEFRALRPYENWGKVREKMQSVSADLREGMMAMMNRVNFFTLLDERDSAQAMEKGLLADFTGSHTLFVNDSQNWTGIESKIIADLFYPDVKTFKKELVGTETVVSIDRARELIGFEPEYTYG